MYTHAYSRCPGIALNTHIHTETSIDLTDSPYESANYSPMCGCVNASLYIFTYIY